MRGKARRGWPREESGQSLVLVLILLVVGALIITPLITFIGTGLRVGQIVYEKKPEELYAVESGLEDALYQIKAESAQLPQNTGDIWQYNIADINGRDVDIAIENIWILEGLVQGSPSDWPESGFILSTEDHIKAEEGICDIYVAYDSRQGDIAVEKIAIWLPRGFEYVAGSSSGITGDEPSQTPARGGTVLEWGPLTLTRPGGLEYPTIAVQSFSLTPLQHPQGVLSWIVSTEGEDTCLTWNQRSRIYKVQTQLHGQPGTVVEAYVAREKSSPTWAMESDYRAIGNSLMIHQTGSSKVREILLDESSGEITDIPTTNGSAVVAAAFLYWSAFVEESELGLGLKSEEVYFKAESSNGTVLYDGMVQAAPDKWDEDNAGQGEAYACYADVTSLLVGGDGNGIYTVGSVYGTPGYEYQWWGWWWLYPSWSEWCYAGWSLIIIYAHPDEDPHYLELYSDFGGSPQLTPRYVDSYDSGTVTITGFTAPADWWDLEARLTTFAGEGDSHYTGDWIKFNGDYLQDDDNPYNNVMNSLSSTGGGQGQYIDGVDVDTFDASGAIMPGDTSAEIEYQTGIDIWNWIYLIVSIRSHFEPGAGGSPYSVGIITYR